MEKFDVVILGAGGMGSSALYHLARKGKRVCAIDQFNPPHDRGSSHGQTRIIRQAYYEHPNYVPLLKRSYQLWEELERESGHSLFERCGLLVAGSGESAVIRGQEVCYREHDLPHEILDSEQVSSRYPGIHLHKDYMAYFDPIGGFLRVEQCIENHLLLAQQAGATLYSGETVTDWAQDGEGVVVKTNLRQIAADRLVIASGAWAAPLLQELDVTTRVIRKVLFWYHGENLIEFKLGKMPCFLVGKDDMIFYGFPAIDPWGLKVAEHTTSTDSELIDPYLLNNELTESDRQSVDTFVDEFFPKFKAKLSRHTTCMYTMTPDEHFVVDIHPNYSSVVIAAGFSGHGFKFSSVIGEILSDLAIEGITSQPIDFLGLNRFS